MQQPGRNAGRRMVVAQSNYNYNYNYNMYLLCAPYKQNDGALHCYDVLTIKTLLNKKSFEASLESFDRARRRLQF